jgi:hypothetical protein
MIGESVRVLTLEFSPQVFVGVQASGWITGYEEAIPRDSRHYSGLPTNQPEASHFSRVEHEVPTLVSVLL